MDMDEDDDSCPPLEHEVVPEDEEEEVEVQEGEGQGEEGQEHEQRKEGGEEEEAAPVDFQVPSSDTEDDDENFDQLSPATSEALCVGAVKVQCPLCGRKREQLTCKKCIRGGNFYVQNKNYRNAPQSRESYADLIRRFETTKRNLEDLKSQCSTYTEKQAKIEEIKDAIEKCRSTIALQNQLQTYLQTRTRNAKKESDIFVKKSEEKVKMWPVYRKRLDNMKAEYVRSCTKLKTFYEGVQKRQDNLKQETRVRITQLRNHIFPIDEVNPANRSGPRALFGTGSADSWSDEEDDTVRSLMVARSSYWSRPDELVSSFGTCYTITGPYGPTLPASGDYSAYSMWAERNQTPSGVTSGSPTHRNPAHCISAALTYTTQFVNLIAYYLDLRLPHRLSYSELRNGDLVNGKFNKKVAKLNANVIHLCSSQGIHATSLQPRKTISNLLLLFDSEQADLGRRGPFEVASQLAKSMEDSIEKDLVIYDEGAVDSDTEWSDSNFPSDWETINRAAVCEEFGLEEMRAAIEHANPALSFTNTESIYRSSSANSLAGAGLLSSVSSFFRGWGK